MKSKVLRKKAYQQLIHTLYLKTLGIIALAIGVVLILRIIVKGRMGNLIASFLSIVYQISWDDAQWLYLTKVRPNKTYIVLIAMLICFLLFFRLLLGWFMKYFDEIIVGINQLTIESDERISMGPELGFAAEKLNMVKEELKRRRVAKQEAEKRKDELVVYLAHDIRTPLTSIIGYLNLLMERKDLQQEQAKIYIEIILEKANQLEKLINELFEITRYNVQTITLQKEWIDLSYMMIQLTDEAYPFLTSNEKQVELDIPEQLQIYVDPEKMARVFNNILRNDVIYSEDRSTITIRASEEENVVNIIFENEGSIPEDKVDKIFEKFYRIDEGRQTSTIGTGLGLAIAKDIVQLHGGRIKVVSNANKTIFSIDLPSK